MRKVWIVFLLLVALACLLWPIVAVTQTIQVVSVTTNIPAWGFDAATPLGKPPFHAQQNSSNFCHSVTLNIVGGPTGVYNLKWNYALGNPRTNYFTNGYSIEGHWDMNVFPPVTHTAAVTTITYPTPPVVGTTNNAFWRLEKR